MAERKKSLTRSESMRGNKNPLGFKHSKKTREKMAKNKNHWKGGHSLGTAAEYLIYKKKLVYDHYGWRCGCCGETTPQFLSVDHVNNDGYLDKNKSGKKITGAPLYAKIVREGFGDRYQILCMNCNHGKRMNGGICPHNAI